MENKITVCCPQCKHEFSISIDRVLTENAEKDLKGKLDIENKKREKLIKKMAEENEALLKKLSTSKEDALLDARKELAEKEALIKAEAEKMAKKRASIFLLEKENELIRKQQQIDLTLAQKLQETADKVRSEEHLKTEELRMQLGEQKKLAAEMQRKAEQGSTQLQGEVQELELEKMLRDFYPLDEITEIKKGQKGADVLQNVITRVGNSCGKIYWESKRTKKFEDNWIVKLKEDNLEMKADILVIATEAMPEDQTRYFLQDGVWICPYLEAKPLAMVLRYGLIQMAGLKTIQHGRESKMEILYNFFSSPEFKGQFEAILEGFKELQEGYNDEKLRMLKICKEREKQLDRILTNTVLFYGSIKGIGGSSIPDIKMLEAPQEKK